MAITRDNFIFSVVCLADQDLGLYRSDFAL